MTEKIYKLIADHSKDMIKVIDIHGNVKYASPSHKTVLGYTDESNIFEYVHPKDLNKVHEAMKHIMQTKEAKELQLRKRHRDGHWVWVETAYSPVLSDEGVVENVILISREFTYRRNREKELKRMAYHDFLTGIYNRRKMMLAIDESLNEARIQGEKLAILIIDMDKFKQINDTFGHDVGDKVLVEFARRLMNVRSEKDAVGRLSGDEFAVVMRDIEGEQDVQTFIRQFRQILAVPYRVAGLETPIRMKSSIGFAIYPDHGQSSMELFKRADNQLYEEKSVKDRMVCSF